MNFRLFTYFFKKVRLNTSCPLNTFLYMIDTIKYLERLELEATDKFSRTDDIDEHERIVDKAHIDHPFHWSEVRVARFVVGVPGVASEAPDISLRVP